MPTISAILLAMKNITVLVVPQHSEVEKAMELSYDWKTYTRIFRPFDEVAALFPDAVREVSPEDGPC